MKLSTIRVSQIFNTGALHEADPEGEIERLLGEYFDELAAKYCAASPWRFDVENAPKDGTEVLVAVDSGGPIIFVVGPITEADLKLTPIIAFATINPPEVPDVLGE